MQKIEIDCVEVRRELTEYFESEILNELRLKIETHLRQCRRCKAIYDGVANILKIIGSGVVFSIPPDMGVRLYDRICARACD